MGVVMISNSYLVLAGGATKQEKQLRTPAWDRVPVIDFPSRFPTALPARRTSADLGVVSVVAAGDFSYFYLVDGKVLRPECP